MEAKELRIGNWVNHASAQSSTGYEPHQVQAYMFDKLDWNLHRPIDLTEEWLEKFGFKKGTKGWFVIDFNFESALCIAPLEGRFFVELMQENQKIVLPSIQYIHQLQNLYFALTGEELEVK